MVLINLKVLAKFGPLVKLLAKLRLVLTYSYSQNFCNCWHAGILIKMCLIAQKFYEPCSGSGVF